MKSQDYYLTILSHALVAIRSLEVDGDVSQAWKIADMLHNLPATLRYEWTRERESELREQIEAKARVHGLETALRSWERLAEEFEKRERG
ncbi:MAG: hypothetical protein AB7O52_19285 [Planctomycetota bacterium]